MGKSRSSIEFRETTENNMPGVSIILWRNFAVVILLLLYWTQPSLKTLKTAGHELSSLNKGTNIRILTSAWTALFNCCIESFPRFFVFFGRRPIRISRGRLQRLRLQFVNAYSYSAGEGLEVYDMINKTVRAEARRK